MASKDSACFDKRLVNPQPSDHIVPFHINNPNDPGTRLLVEGTTATFRFLQNLYLALKHDSRSVMSIHEFYLLIAEREVRLLEHQWLQVIYNAKETLLTLKKKYVERLEEEPKDEPITHVSLCEGLTPEQSHIWNSKVMVNDGIIDKVLPSALTSFLSTLETQPSHQLTLPTTSLAKLEDNESDS